MVLRIRGLSSYGEVLHPFQKIRYVDKFAEVDFFRSIGRMTVPALQKDRYSDESGNISPCANAIFSNEAEWQKMYWQTFESTITTKLQDWQHENEYRDSVLPFERLPRSR